MTCFPSSCLAITPPRHLDVTSAGNALRIFLIVWKGRVVRYAVRLRQHPDATNRIISLTTALPMRSSATRSSQMEHMLAAGIVRLVDMATLLNITVDMSKPFTAVTMVAGSGYEISSEPPLDVQRLGLTPLSGSLRTPPGTALFEGCARRAFSPGVASSCGAASTQSFGLSAQRTVAENTIELFFGRRVAVSHASIAGKIHDTELNFLRHTKANNYGSRFNKPHVVAPGTGKRFKKHCHVARVEISARLAADPKQWLVLGTYDGCQNGHNERLISLANCVAAARDGAVRCIAPRFRAISWHNKPMIRVGAYGHETDNNSKKVRTSTSHNSAAFEDGVEYVLHRSTRRNDGSDAARRRYAFKGKSVKDSWGWEEHGSRAARRRNFRADVKEALSL